MFEVLLARDKLQSEGINVTYEGKYISVGIEMQEHIG